QRHVEEVRAATGGGDLSAAESWVAVGAIAGRGDDLHLRPVGVELLGYEHRHGRHASLPHLDRRRDDGDRAVRCDRDPHVDLQRPLPVSPRASTSKTEIEGEGERQPCGRTDDECASRAAGGHGYTSPRAARSMARTIRPYVPQRQRLPFIACTI